jgi:hypothetical protein
MTPRMEKTITAAIPAEEVSPRLKAVNAIISIITKTERELKITFHSLSAFLLFKKKGKSRRE